jgi:hypothetical protein
MDQELHYIAKQLSLAELDLLLDRFWAEMQSPGSAVSRKAQEQGLDIGQFLPLTRAEVIQVKKSGDTLDPLVTPIVVIFVLPVAAHIAKDLWTYVLLPRIKGEKGGGHLIEDDSKAPKQ